MEKNNWFPGELSQRQRHTSNNRNNNNGTEAADGAEFPGMRRQQQLREQQRQQQRQQNNAQREIRNGGGYRNKNDARKPEAGKTEQPFQPFRQSQQKARAPSTEGEQSLANTPPKYKQKPPAKARAPKPKGNIDPIQFKINMVNAPEEEFRDMLFSYQRKGQLYQQMIPGIQLVFKHQDGVWKLFTKTQEANKVQRCTRQDIQTIAINFITQPQYDQLLQKLSPELQYVFVLSIQEVLQKEGVPLNGFFYMYSLTAEGEFKVDFELLKVIREENTFTPKIRYAKHTRRNPKSGWEGDILKILLTKENKIKNIILYYRSFENKRYRNAVRPFMSFKNPEKNNFIYMILAASQHLHHNGRELASLNRFLAALRTPKPKKQAILTAVSELRALVETVQRDGQHPLWKDFPESEALSRPYADLSPELLFKFFKHIRQRAEGLAETEQKMVKTIADCEYID